MRNPSLPNWLVVSTLGAVVVGTLAMSKHADSRVTDDEPGFDCRLHGNRTCGSDVAGREPGTYAAPDGKTYRVVPVTAYDACLYAARVPGSSGFTPEVCAPLSPGSEGGEYVFTGPMEWTNPGGSKVGVPGLAEDIADRCADTPDALLDCVGALIGERMEHQS